MHAFRPRLCFVQLATDEHLFLTETLAPGLSLNPLAELFADPEHTKFFHAAGGDLEYLAAAGIRVRGLFDTHRAVTLLGWPKVGLADLVREKFQVELQKEHQQSDFSIRPLPPELRSYIADDVRYLVEVGRWVRQACVEADVLEEVELDCRRMSDEAAVKPDVGADYRPKLPRNGLSPVQVALAQAIARELHALRLKWAEAANVPMGRMLSNMAIAELATKPPPGVKEMFKVPGVRGPFVREHGDEVLAVLQGLRAQSERGELASDEKGERPDPARRKRAEALKAWRAEKAKVRKVTPSVVLTNPLLEALAASPPKAASDLERVPYFGDKRLRLYGAELAQLLG
ncbi:MAG TPA: HRDC domain-containing protein, partial [Myxococcaceae bacterium]|nr:HRDC domain-containing protein [Myxococcaceae bacterium]